MEPDGAAVDDELVELVESLDADNERLRVRVLTLLEFAEDAVTAQVSAERQVSVLEAEVQRLHDEIDALHRTRVMRLARPFRALYARVRHARVRRG